MPDFAGLLVNKLTVGSRVFQLSHSDGKAKPDFYFLQHHGVVSAINTSRIPNSISFTDLKGSALASLFSGPSEDRFLKPNPDGFCYYIAEPPNLTSYEVVNGFIKVPLVELKRHMATYLSPWS